MLLCDDLGVEMVFAVETIQFSVDDRTFSVIWIGHWVMKDCRGQASVYFG